MLLGFNICMVIVCSIKRLDKYNVDLFFSFFVLLFGFYCCVELLCKLIDFGWDFIYDGFFCLKFFE